MEIVFRKDIPIVPFHVSIAKPIPLHYRQMAETQVKKMIDDKIIACVDEPTEWLTHAFFVSKSCGTKLRFVESQSRLCNFLLFNGKYRFLVAPQGLSTSSDEFLRRSDYAIQNCHKISHKISG